MVFIEATGRGTVMDLSKTFYDFNISVWHDRRSAPAVGIFAEFSSDPSGRITSIKPSKYQDFSTTEFCKERDFWQTNSDYELDNVVNANRTEYVQQLYRTTKFFELDHIPLSVTINDTIDAYFGSEIRAVDAIKSNQEALEKTPPITLNYFIIKKFLFKALDMLFYMDNSIKQSEFKGIRDLITRLEGAYTEMKDKQKNIDTKKIFDEIFVPTQCYYQALLVAIDTLQNRHKTAQFAVRSCRTEIHIEQQKPKPNEERIQNRTEKIESLNKEMTEITHNIEHYKKMKDHFYKANYEAFDETFKAFREKLFRKIAAGLDTCATIVDTRIWLTALKSSGLRNQYYSKDTNSTAFGAMYFAEFYLSRLDKYQLSDTDQRLNSYITNIIKQQRKRFLVVSADSDLLVDLKLKILELNPFYEVKYAPKRTNFQQLIRDESFDLVYIDEKNAWTSAADIILEGKQLDRYESAKFKVLE